MKITPKIHALKHTFLIPLNAKAQLERFVYSFIIFGKEDIYLVDSGVKSSEKTILHYIKKNGYSINNIKTLILTHSHADHMGSAKNIKDKTNCRILAHPDEKEWIEDIEKQFTDRPVPGFKSLVKKSVKIDKFINDNEIIKLEPGVVLKVIHTPGHSKGSISLFLKKERVLICGDSLLLPGNLPIYENALVALHSINKLKAIKNIDWLLSSWDDPVSKNQVMTKIDQSIHYFKTIHKHIREIEKAKELTPQDLCKIVIENMGLPAAAINPLVAKAFQSNINNLDNPRLI